MQPIQGESIPGAIGGAGVDLFVPADDGVAAIDFADPLAKVAKQLVQSLILSLGGQIPIEIADQTDPDRYIVQVIAMDMATGELAYPTVADFDLSIAGGGTVADYEMVGEAVRHLTHAPMVVIENSRISLSCPAVVDDNIFPAITGYSSLVDRPAHSRCKITPSAAPLGGWHLFGFFLGTRFLNYDLPAVIFLASTENPPTMFLLRRRSQGWCYGLFFFRSRSRQCHGFTWFWRWCC
jgi:hypothetical protein